MSKVKKNLVGEKFDEGKLRWTLLPLDAVQDIVKVLEFGAKKYEVEGWKHVPKGKIRYIDAAFRHLISHVQGEKTDSESGLPHLAHAACCLLFILHLEKK